MKPNNISNKSNNDLVKVIFDLEKSDLHNHATESLWTISLGNNKYLLDNIPFYIYDISYKDIVSAKNINGEKSFQSVVERGGHSTYRIFLLDELDRDQSEEVFKHLKNLGCAYEKGTELLIAVDVPPEVNIFEAYEILEKGEEKGIWEFEEGHCGHTLNNESA